ncbi:hypothetical protein Btru_033129 [Bulinus truncatus]|nr:hypothetical protein Btru_033129 [Bulinus truncatus]
MPGYRTEYTNRQTDNRGSTSSTEQTYDPPSVLPLSSDILPHVITSAEVKKQDGLLPARASVKCRHLQIHVKIRHTSVSEDTTSRQSVSGAITNNTRHGQDITQSKNQKLMDAARVTDRGYK